MFKIYKIMKVADKVNRNGCLLLRLRGTDETNQDVHLIQYFLTEQRVNSWNLLPHEFVVVTVISRLAKGLDELMNTRSPDCAER